MPSNPYMDKLKGLFGDIRIPTGSSVAATMPKEFIVSGGYFSPVYDAAVPATHTLKEVIEAFLKSVPDAIVGDKGDDLPTVSATFHALVAARVGRSTDPGIAKSRPHNSAQVPPAAVALYSAAKRSPRVTAMVDPAQLARLPGLLGKFAYRYKMRGEAVQHLTDMEHAVTEVLVEIDALVRPTIPALRPLADSDAGVSLKPLFALVDEPAEKAQETQRHQEVGRQRGLTEAAAKAPQKAAAGAAPNPAVIVVPPGVPASPAEPAPTPPAPASRRRPR